MRERDRVLVTRAPGGASALAEQLLALGLEPVLVPAIELVAPTSFGVLDCALEELARYDWLLFTSATAAERFADRLEGGAGEGSLPSNMQVAAIGPATARALRQRGLRVDLVPAQAVAESLVAELLPRALRPDGSAARFLLPRAEEARELLPEQLRAAGAEVTVAPAYRTVVPAASIELLRELFAGAGSVPEAITFTSSSTARNLVALCAAAGVSLPRAALRVSIGPITSQILRELGLPPHAEAREATVASLAEEVLRAVRG